MIITKTKKQFELPGEGSHLAVLVDVEDRRAQVTPWGVRDQVRLKWLVKQVGTDGREISVIATYNKSLSDNASFVQAIKDITGRPPGDTFDTETLIGANNRLTLKHEPKKDGSLFPKILAILRPGQGDPVLLTPTWFRRAGDGSNTPPSAAARNAPPKAAVHITPKSKPVAIAATAEQNDALKPVSEPPESGDWDPSQYDLAASFPSSDAVSDEPAA